MTQSNFQFINNETWSFLYENARAAEKYAYVDPRSSSVYGRITAEAAIQWMYRNDPALSWPSQRTFHTLTSETSFRDIVGTQLIHYLDIIRKLGNRAAHPTERMHYRKSFDQLKFLHAFLEWLVKTYEDKDLEVNPYDESLIPTTAAESKSYQELIRLKQEFEAQQETLRQQQQALEESESEKRKLAERLAGVEATREKNKGVKPKAPYSEAETRKKFIDILLEEAGWNLEDPKVKEYEVQGMPNKTGKGYVDYVLWGKDGLPLAVVEAKRTMENERKGRTQAELYANCLEKMTGQRPVIFYTNGFTTWLWDDQMYPPRQVQGFYTQDELARLVLRRTDKKPLKNQAIDKSIAGRYYQEQAIRSVTENWERGRRKSLLVMATGSGKTRTSAAFCKLVMGAGWVKNALFLADRNALVTQAKNAFNEFLPHLTLTDLTKEKENEQSRMVFSTYPTIMNLIDNEQEDGVRFYSPGHFDLIIIDEAHRSVYFKYKAIFDYFDALLLGLTATPKSDVDHNTYELFDLDNHEPTYDYDLDKAVRDKYLVPPKSISVPLKFHRQGIKYKELSEKDKDEYELQFRDEEGNLPDEIGSAALNDWLFNEKTADLILAYVMENGLKIEGGDKIGKTIIFARSHKHAEFIEDRFNILYPELKGNFLRIIDNYDKHAQSILDDFSEKDKYPQIAVSVDMLDTGVDVPEVLNLVFWKPVKSKAKFWQMIGRGTRLCPDIFGPGQNKEHFLIFDFCENFEFFEQFPEGFKPSAQLPISQKIFRARLEIAEQLRNEQYHDEIHQNYRIELLDHLHKSIQSLDRNKFRVRPFLKELDRFEQREAWLSLSSEDNIILKERLSSLPDPEGEDELARRFDLLTLNLQLAILANSRSQEGLINKIIEIAHDLVKKGNLPAVAQQMPIIKELRKDTFWREIGVTNLEYIRLRMRDLMKFVDREQQKIVYTNFVDQIVDGDIKVGDPLEGYKPVGNYRQKLKSFVEENRNHLTIRKLNTNQPITTQELEELERLLFSSGELGTKEQFQQAEGKDQPLGAFIRKIIGLDVNAAKESFADFLSSGSLSATQIEFIDEIINHLEVNGTIEPKMLFRSPFTDINEGGLSGVFPDEQADKIVEIIRKINGNAGTVA